MRRRVNTTMDSDALQADVMRFMAIIAFCLIAVLALVRQIEPVAAEAPQPELPAVEPAAPLAEAPVPADEAQAPEPVAVPADEADALVPAAVPAERTTPQLSAVPPVLPLEPSALAPIEPAAPPPPVAEIAVPPATPVTKTPSQSASTEQRSSDEGLILRFATDQDFLRLVAKGDIRVFLFGAESSYRLRSDYRFAEASTPRQLFEVMPETVPALIRQQATTLPEHPSLRYGLHFPERIERQLDAYLAQVDSGALLIDRFGHVSHVSAEP